MIPASGNFRLEYYFAVHPSAFQLTERPRSELLSAIWTAKRFKIYLSQLWRFSWPHRWIKSEFGEALMPVSKQLLLDWFRLHDSPPKELFHYTSVAGVLGIVQSNRLWATDATYLNDPSELLHAHQLIQTELESRAESANHEVLKEFFQRALRAIDPFDGTQDYLIACFCEEPDLLSQWRAYAALGGGYALGFETRWMEGTAQPSDSLALRRVIYDHDKQRELVSNTLDEASRKLAELSAGMDVSTANSMIAMFVAFLRDHLAEFHFSFKNKAFEEEREWRLILSSHFIERDKLLKQLRFRAIRGSLVPYVELDFSATAGPSSGRLPLSSVVFGPTLDPDWAKRSLDLLLRQAGYHFAKISSSAVPLRA